MDNGFDAWWTRYPSKVGKLTAIKAYTKALKLATPDELMNGLDRYIRDKPDYANWCHPATWLNGGRWMDELKPMRKVPVFTEEKVFAEQRDSRGHQPPCQTWSECTQRVLDEARAAREKSA